MSWAAWPQNRDRIIPAVMSQAMARPSRPLVIRIRPTAPSATWRSSTTDSRGALRRSGEAAHPGCHQILEETMRLDPHDLSLFYTLHKTLMFFVNQRLHIIEKPLDSPEQVGNLPPDEVLKLRDALLANMDLIDAFASENPFQRPEEELEV